MLEVERWELSLALACRLWEEVSELSQEGQVGVAHQKAGKAFQLGAEPQV